MSLIAIVKRAALQPARAPPADRRSAAARHRRNRQWRHLTVTGIIELAELWGAPAFLAAFFGASVETSLLEGIVAYTALRRGESALAVGDVLGSSFADATLSISMGPLLFPTVIDGDLALRAALVTAGAAAVVALLLGRGGELGWRGGAIWLLVYAVSWPLLL